jgi:energy-coupling factor transport system ATP-binding protein
LLALAPSPLLRLEKVSYWYVEPGGKERRPALRDLSLEIEAGSYVAVLGRNGSGKSTLAKLLNGLLLPRGGRVVVAGIDTRQAARDPRLLRQVRQTVGLVLQNPDNQLVATVVEEDVAFGPENLGLPREEIRRRVDSALAAVDLSQLRGRAPHHLSGGQRQRVAIAGILAMRPRVLVLDESTALLDPEGRREVLAVAHRLHEQTGTTIVQVTHFMAEAAQAGRVVVLDQGRVALDGTPRAVFAQGERLRALGLDVPQVTQLAERLQPSVPTDVLTVEELADAVARAVGAQPDAPPDGAEPGAAIEATDGHEPAPLIRVEDLWHTYGRGTPYETVSLRGASFDLRPGERAAIIGHTGSGKSTLVQHLNGLLRPQRGRVVVGDLDLADPRTDARLVRRRVGLVFQFAEQQLFDPTVGDDVAFGPRRLGLDRAEVRRRVRDALAMVGLGFEAFKDRYTFGLSGGEMRRVAIAGVLALEPEVLVLDEPTASLDPAGRTELLERLRALNRQRGTALVFVSHNMEEVAELVERVWVLGGGRTVLSGPTRAVFRQVELLRDHGLGVPQVAALMHSLAARGLPVPPDVLTVDEAAAALQLVTTRG